MNKVRAKFTCESINILKDHADIKFQPVTEGSKENEDFYKWTPAGSIHLAVVSKDIAKGFDTDTEYYIDFTKAGE